MSERRVVVGDHTIVLAGDDRLSRSGRAFAWALALCVLLGGGLLWAGLNAQPADPDAAAPAAPVQSLPSATVSGRAAAEGSASPVTGAIAAEPGPATPPTGPDVHLDDAIVAEWGGPAVHLDWRGRGYATAEATFVGDRVAAPGDRVERTLRIGNAGPSDAVMTVALELDRLRPEASRNPELADAVTLFWDVGGVTGSETFAALLERQTGGATIAEVQVGRGEEVGVTLGFSVDVALAEQAAAGAPSTVLSFLTDVRMAGDTVAVPGEAPPLAATGMQMAGGALLAVAFALILMGLGLTVLRRRVCDACGEAISRREPLVTVRTDGATARFCAACAPAHALTAATAR
ncbi:hypothetical protein [Microbacterium sp. NPDC096154]|uniref:hypothetical protein n=1 Tax=Microbacterium sp. NPDC096154 TaxID=3155549 RepID=UPI00332379C9